MNIREFCRSTASRGLFAVLALGGCTAAATAPHSGAIDVAQSAPVSQSAFVIDLQTTRARASVSAPTRSIIPPPLAASGVAPMAQLSLLGSDAVDIAVSNLARGTVGAVVAGKALVTFDMRIVTKLNGVRLVTPTFPLPPRGVVGVQVFPFEAFAITSQGGVGSSSNTLAVTSPRFGAVQASDDWDGAPHSFFHATPCAEDARNCYRYEPFGELAPLSASAPRRVGFLVDPTVGDIRVRVLIAADLRMP